MLWLLVQYIATDWPIDPIQLIWLMAHAFQLIIAQGPSRAPTSQELRKPLTESFNTDDHIVVEVNWERYRDEAIA